MKSFLCLKHWQLFSLLLGLPILFCLAGIGWVLKTHNEIAGFAMILISMVLSIAIYFGWLWTLGTKLHPKLPSQVKMNLTSFKSCLIIALLSLISLTYYILYFFNRINTHRETGPGFIALVFTFEIFYIPAIIYCYYFVAKELKSVEKQQAVKFGDFAGYFALVWIYLIGIWFIQPVINGLFCKDSQQNNP